MYFNPGQVICPKDLRKVKSSFKSSAFENSDLDAVKSGR